MRDLLFVIMYKDTFFAVAETSSLAKIIHPNLVAWAEGKAFGGFGLFVKLWVLGAKENFLKHFLFNK